MKINKITTWEEGKIIVEVEGYSHAQPVFPANLSEEELQTKVDEWAIIQTEVDSINNGTATQEIIDKHAPQPRPKTLEDITEVINNTLRVRSSIMAENFYTESKVVDKAVNYTLLFDKDKLSNKETHKNKVVIQGRSVLDLEQRVADLEGVIADLLKNK